VTVGQELVGVEAFVVGNFASDGNADAVDGAASEIEARGASATVAVVEGGVGVAGVVAGGESTGVRLSG
jgi:hypothetical protein